MGLFAGLALASAVDLASRGGGAGGLPLVVPSAAFAVTGALVVARHGSNVIAWVLLGAAVSAAVTLAAETWVEVPGRAARDWVGWVAAWMWMVWTSLIAVFLPLHFPTGRLPSPRWRPVLWLGGIALALQVVAIALYPGELQSISTAIVNPIATDAGTAGIVESTLVVGTVAWGASFVGAAASFVHRFRRSRGTERQQLKWVAIASVVIGVGGVLVAVGERLPTRVAEAVGGVGYLLLAGGLWVAMPAAVAVAVLRHRLFDVDVVVNRTLVYATLTAVLGSTYLASVLVLQELLVPLAGGSDLAVAGSTLAVAALFGPARRRVQRAVDRRFYRRRYDAHRTVEAFSARLRSELDLGAVGQDLRAVDAETVQPAHVSLWLRGSP